MNSHAPDRLSWDGEPHFASDQRELDRSYLLDLIRVLTPHRGGLRRWAIMRAIRKNREMAGLPIPQKIEDGVERMFRRHCEESDQLKKREGSVQSALFHWPQGKTGGLWAVYADRAEAWLKAEDSVTF